MRIDKPQLLQNLASDIELELSKLAKLEARVQKVKQNIDAALEYADYFYESLALKFYNFYMGCERIFCCISTELSGDFSRSLNWDKRLFERMSIDLDERKAVISSEAASLLEEFLWFRHVVRSLYSYEVDAERVDRLLVKYPVAWAQVETDIRSFVDWLRELAIALDT